MTIETYTDPERLAAWMLDSNSSNAADKNGRCMFDRLVHLVGWDEANRIDREANEIAEKREAEIRRQEQAVEERERLDASMNAAIDALAAARVAIRTIAVLDPEFGDPAVDPLYVKLLSAADMIRSARGLAPAPTTA